jgi:putative toxin-antitoxin system antitoxin component (TIGR02293 family)
MSNENEIQKYDLTELSILYGVRLETMKSIINSDSEHHIHELMQLMSYAISYFGSKENARRWFIHKNRGLGNVTPMSLLKTNDGIDRVKSTITKLKHGMTP